MILLSTDKIREQIPITEQLICACKVVGRSDDAIGVAGMVDVLADHDKPLLELSSHEMIKTTPARSPPWLHPDLTGLVAKPGGVSDWDRFTQTGWNGPYISADDDKYLQDAWGTNYIYSQGSRTIKSVGSGDTLTVRF